MRQTLVQLSEAKRSQTKQNQTKPNISQYGKAQQCSAVQCKRLIINKGCCATLLRDQAQSSNQVQLQQTNTQLQCYHLNQGETKLLQVQLLLGLSSNLESSKLSSFWLIICFPTNCSKKLSGNLQPSHMRCSFIPRKEGVRAVAYQTHRRALTMGDNATTGRLYQYQCH